MLELNDDWEFNLLGIYNYRKLGEFDAFFDFVRTNHDKIDGDIVEAGVFRGNSIIALGMLLTELGSKKKVYGFDSFSGFPPVFHPNDAIEKFEYLHSIGEISDKHIEAVRFSRRIRERFSKLTASAENISGSGNFSGTSMELVREKIEFIGLDNIVLVDGPFSTTMNATRVNPSTIMGVVMDCDLYQSYLQTFDFVWERLETNGMVFLGEYYSLKFPGAKIATDEFLRSKPSELEALPHKNGDFERWHAYKR